MITSSITIKHPELALPARDWCGRHDAVFVPYSIQRNLPFILAAEQQGQGQGQGQDAVLSTREALNAAASAHGVSLNAVVLKFFLQSGE